MFPNQPFLIFVSPCVRGKSNTVWIDIYADDALKSALRCSCRRHFQRKSPGEYANLVSSHRRQLVSKLKQPSRRDPIRRQQAIVPGIDDVPTLQPAIVLGLVRVEIVENDMQFAARMLGGDPVHEVNELDPAAALVLPAGDLATRHVERREQRGLTMPLVVVCARRSFSSCAGPIGYR